MDKLSKVIIIALIFSAMIFTGCGTNKNWTKTFGGPADDEGRSVQQTRDGGYIITGVTYSYGAGYADFYLIKTDANGNTSWTKTFGFRGNDYGGQVQQTKDGGYIIIGSAEASGAVGNYDVYLIKTDANGNTSWTRTFVGSGGDYGWSVQQTTDGGYIIAGATIPYKGVKYGYGYYDVYLIKTDAKGDTSWIKTFGGPAHDYGFSVDTTSDGGYIITGNTQSYGKGGKDVWLIKTDADGDTSTQLTEPFRWTKTFGESADDEGRSVQQTRDGGYIITGGTNSYGAGGYDVYLIKTAANGGTSWIKTFGGPAHDYGFSVDTTSDGGYIIAGYTASSGNGEKDVYLIKTAANGDTSWTKTFGGKNDDEGHSVQQTRDGGYIITGYTASSGNSKKDVYLIKTDENGNVKVGQR